MRSQINKMLAPLRRRIKVLFTRGVVSLIDPSTLMQTVQAEILAGEVLDGVEHFEPYGFTSSPKAGAEGLFAALGGDRARTVCITIGDRRYRLKNLAAGEVALYTDEGDTIVFKRNRNIEITAGTKVKVTAPTVEIVGNGTISGSLTVQGAILSNTSIADPAGTLAEARGYYNGHSHPGGVVTPQMT